MGCPLAVQDLSGKLWFTASEGVIVIDADQIIENRYAPSVVIEQILIDEKPITLNSQLEIPAGNQKLQINFTAPSFVAPEKVHFKYRLEGFDHDWIDVSINREVVYTNLAPKHYKFHVIACNNDGIWNEVGSTLDFNVHPAFYQTL